MKNVNKIGISVLSVIMIFIMTVSALNVIINVRKIGTSVLSVNMIFSMTVSVLNVIINVTKIVRSALGVITFFIMTVVNVDLIAYREEQKTFIRKHPSGCFFYVKSNHVWRNVVAKGHNLAIGLENIRNH